MWSLIDEKMTQTAITQAQAELKLDEDGLKGRVQIYAQVAQQPWHFSALFLDFCFIFKEFPQLIQDKILEIGV
ncbi:hypothetical protein AGMMS49940_13570 [Spirochaetia bacterium]|nr:hypothetical protein AGMMS49940_13570 [Spirochaetia bacterium]